MRKIYFLFFGLVLTLVVSSQSPITLSSSSFPVSGDTLRYSTATIASAGNYTQTGANFVWNYSGLVYSGQGRRDFIASSQTPYFFYFLSLTEFGEKKADIGAGPILITNNYDFYKKQTSPINAYIADGSGMTYSSLPIPNYYSNKDELYVLPLTYPKYDSTTFRFSTFSASTVIPISYSKTGYRVTKVDGWGTVTTPFGTQNCLRIETTQYSKDTIKTTIIPIGFTNNQRSYQWLTTTNKIPFLEISGTLVGNNFTPTSVKYVNTYQNPAGLPENMDVSSMDFYPNPGKDKLWLNFTRKGEFFVEVLDLSGKLIKNGIYNSDNLGQSIDISDLRSSVYIMKVTENQKAYFYKFVKE